MAMRVECCHSFHHTVTVWVCVCVLWFLFSFILIQPTNTERERDSFYEPWFLVGDCLVWWAWLEWLIYSLHSGDSIACNLMMNALYFYFINVYGAHLWHLREMFRRDNRCGMSIVLGVQITTTTKTNCRYGDDIECLYAGNSLLLWLLLCQSGFDRYNWQIHACTFCDMVLVSVLWLFRGQLSNRVTNDSHLVESWFIGALHCPASHGTQWRSPPDQKPIIKCYQRFDEMRNVRWLALVGQQMANINIYIPTDTK